MTVTEIKRKGKSEIYKLFLNNNFWGFVEGEVIVKHHLKVGGEINADELETIKEESDRLICSSMALSYVSKSLKTEFQLRQYLKKYKFNADAIEMAITKLKNYGYLNDEYYAKLYASSLSSSKGKNYIKRELSLKGIKDGDISEALEEIGDGYEACLAVTNKWLKGKALPLDLKTKEKLQRFLIYRGFDYETIRKVIGVSENDYE